MQTIQCLTSLSEQRQQLVRLMQDLNYGRIEGLLVRDGEPVLSSVSRVLREHKFGGENGARRERRQPDFRLKAQVIELLELLDDLVDGKIEVIEVQTGLPFRVLVAGSY